MGAGVSITGSPIQQGQRREEETLRNIEYNVRILVLIGALILVLLVIWLFIWINEVVR